MITVSIIKVQLKVIRLCKQNVLHYENPGNSTDVFLFLEEHI